jgi:peptide/nickel transport system substrate-binding protein
MFSDGREKPRAGKARTIGRLLAALALCGLSAGSAFAAQSPAAPLRLLVEQPPATLNPRFALDAPGQRIGALIFRALTRVSEDLKPLPDLASSWKTRRGGVGWEFVIVPDARDHSGQPITAELIARCLEQYRVGRPTSPHAAAFPGWKGTRAEGTRVIVEMKGPDPYFPMNATLLRYFRQEGQAEPCTEPDPSRAVISSGRLRPEPWAQTPENEIKLVPVGGDARALTLSFVRDETTRALTLLRGLADLAQNSLSLTKTRWFQTRHADRFAVLEREGVTVSYLAFNLRDPALSRLEVRRAIAHAIDREAIIQGKMMGFGSLAGSFLSPRLEESWQTPLRFDPAVSIRLLEDAGFHADSNGVRLRLRYKTTPVREGMEQALMIREMLGRVGIEVTLDVVEPAVFYALVRKGSYQLHAARWVGVSDASILYKSLQGGNPLNRAGYSNPEVDQLLERLASETDPARRIPIAQRIQRRMGDDLPYFPLWTWSNSLIVRKELEPEFRQIRLSLSGALDPLVFR